MTEVSVIRVILVDDHHVVRRGLRSFLESFSDIQVVEEAATGEEAVSHIDQWLPDVAVVDLMLPGGIDGIEVTRQLRAISPHTQIVMLTAQQDNSRVLAALRAGALGYVRKADAPEALLNAIRGAAHGQSVLDPSVAGEIFKELNDDSKVKAALTEREMDVLRLLTNGQTNREIAATLVVSEETVKTHVGNILSKLHLVHRTQAALYALKKGLISLDDINL
jgi:two-component system, NarL family, response regulator LiaR